MAPLSQSHVADLIETCVELSRERDQIRDVVATLPNSFAELRAALNKLHNLIG